MKLSLATILTLLSFASFAFILPPNERPLPVVDVEIIREAVHAIFEGDIGTLKRLVREGADPNFSSTGERNIFHTISDPHYVKGHGINYPVKFSSETLDALRYLISLGVKTDRFSGSGGSTPLRLAFQGVSGDYPHCRAGLIGVLLEGGADPDKGTRSGATYKVWSPFESATPFCGNEALDIYFSYRPNFLRGRCVFPIMGGFREQEILNEHIGNGAKIPYVALHEYFEKVGIPTPSLRGPFGARDNPEWIEWKKQCPLL